MSDASRSASDGPEDFELGIKSLKVENGETRIETNAPPEIIAWFYACFKELLDEHNAPNFIQMELKPAGEVDRYMVTVQKVPGKTPIDKMNELKTAASEVVKAHREGRIFIREIDAETEEACGALDDLAEVLSA